MAPAHLLQNADRVTISSLKTGAEISAKIIDTEERTNLTLLRATGYSARPLKLGVYADYSGRSISSVTVSGLRAYANDVPNLTEGSVGRVNGDIIEHNAMIPKSGFGGPLLNTCFEVVGVNRPEQRRRIRSQKRQKAPESIVYASNLAQLTFFLNRNNVNYEVASLACPTAEQRIAEEQRRADDNKALANIKTFEANEAKLEADHAIREAKKASEEADKNKKDAEIALARSRRAYNEKKALETTSQEEKERLKEEIAKLAAEAEEARVLVSQEQEKLDTLKDQQQATSEQLTNEKNQRTEDALTAKKQREADALKAKEQRKKIFIIAGAVGAFLALLLLMVLIRSRHLKQGKVEAERVAQLKSEAAHRAERVAVEALKEFPDGVFEGQDAIGRRIAVRYSGASLVRQGELIIGRHPKQADIVIDDPSISRAHAALYLIGEELLANDLDSTNGSKLNDSELEAEREPVADGDEFTFGDVVLTLKFI